MDDAERAGKLVAVEDVVERFETAAVELRRGTEVLRRDVEGRCCARCKGPNPKLDAGSRVVLPCAADGYIIRSAPMPGNHEDHEAFIGLAAGERLAFEGLIGRAGGSPEETIRTGVSAATSFAALAKLDTSRLALSVLPYRVTR